MPEQLGFGRVKRKDTFEHRGRLTAERGDGRVNWLDENALAMKL